MEKQNKDFLSRIEFILGDRKKHPWGRMIGINTSRIDSIFRGDIPKGDALKLIHFAERVSIDWLLTGEGVPFCVSDSRNDRQCAELLQGFLGDAPWSVFVVRGLGPECLLVLSRPEVIEFAPGKKSRFTDVRVLPRAGRRALSIVEDLRDAQSVRVNDRQLSDLAAGKLGPVHLLGTDTTLGMLAGAHPLAMAELRESVAVYEAIPPEGDEAAVLHHYRALDKAGREAVRTVIQRMDRTYTFDLGEAPPGRVVPVDAPSDTKRDALGGDAEMAPTDEVDAQD